MSARRQSWRLAWPLILSNLSVPILGMVDTAVVGHLDDPVPLAAVALGANLMSALYFLFGFLRMGTTALAAQAVGAADALETRAVLARALAVAVFLGAAILLATPALIALAAVLLAPSSAVAPAFATYVAIRVFGAPAALANFALLGWFLGLQDARRPLVVMLATNGANALLDVALVFGLGMAADGVALATVLAEYAGLGLAVLLARPGWRAVRAPALRARDLLRGDRFRRLLRVNRDLFLRSLLLEAAFLGFVGLSSRQGDLVLAANAVLMTFFTLSAYGLDGFAHAAEALIGKAVGARDLAAFRAAVRASFANALLLAAALTAALWAGGEALVALLTDLPEVRRIAGEFLAYAALLPAVAVWAFLFDGVFFGATRTRELRDGMALALLLFAAGVALLVPPLGNHGLWLAFLAFLGGRGAVLALIYRRASWGASFVAAAA